MNAALRASTAAGLRVVEACAAMTRGSGVGRSISFSWRREDVYHFEVVEQAIPSSKATAFCCSPARTLPRTVISMSLRGT
jgi:hypothetical protein